MPFIQQSADAVAFRARWPSSVRSVDYAWGADLLHETVAAIDEWDDAQDREAIRYAESQILEMQPAATIVLEAAAPGLGQPMHDEQLHRWFDLRERALRGIGYLTRGLEARERMRSDAPELVADRLHAWVWESARSLWGSAHFGEAVRAAAVRVNAETQSKVGRRQVGETDLFKQVFSLDPPKPGRPRLSPDPPWSNRPAV
jgi:hypothetical protein